MLFTSSKAASSSSSRSGEVAGWVTGEVPVGGVGSTAGGGGGGTITGIGVRVGTGGRKGAGGFGTGGSIRTAFRSIARLSKRSRPKAQRSTPLAINPGKVPGNPLSRSVRPRAPEPSSAAIPETPSLSKWIIRMDLSLGDARLRC